MPMLRACSGHGGACAVTEPLRALADAGVVVSPVAARDADDAVIVLITVERHTSTEAIQRLAEQWREGVRGTPLEDIKVVIVSDDVRVEILRKPTRES